MVRYITSNIEYFGLQCMNLTNVFMFYKTSIYRHIAHTLHIWISIIMRIDTTVTHSFKFVLFVGYSWLPDRVYCKHWSNTNGYTFSNRVQQSLFWFPLSKKTPHESRNLFSTLEVYYFWATRTFEGKKQQKMHLEFQRNIHYIYIHKRSIHKKEN